MKAIQQLLLISLLGMIVGCTGNVTVKGLPASEDISSKRLADVKVNDLRMRLDGAASSHREAAFGFPMGMIEFDPSEKQFIKEKLESQLTQLLVESGVRSRRFYVADMLEFHVNTDTTMFYWDVIGKIHLILKDGEKQYDLLGTHTARTYVWPGKKIITEVIDESMKQIANELPQIVSGVAAGQYTDNKAFHRISLEGFSVIPPDNDKWIIAQKDRYSISLYRKVESTQIYSVIAFAKLNPLSPPVYSISGLAEFVEGVEKLAISDQRFEDYQYSISLVDINENSCVRSDFSAIDRDVYHDDTSYVLEGMSTFCLLPNSTNMAALIGFSQRYKKGTEPLALESEIPPFVESINFEGFDEYSC